MTGPLRGFNVVAAALRSWQDYHMDTHKWSDIAYQIAVDQEGRKYYLRGMGTKSGANGHTDVNDRFGAILLIVANDEQPSALLVEAIQEVIADFRDIYPGANKIVGHGDLKSTACPGKHVQALIRAGQFEPQPAAPVKPTRFLPGIQRQLRVQRNKAKNPARRQWLNKILRALKRGPQ
jgi:hypothetical protein